MATLETPPDLQASTMTATTELATTQPRYGQPLAVSPVPTASEINRLILIANAIAKSKIYDKAATPQKAFVLVLAGRELGIGPMQSLRELDIIEGKVGLTANALIARVHRLRLGTVRTLESTDAKCVMQFQRYDDPNNQLTVTWTIEQAEAAGLLVSNTGRPKKNWKCFPRQMLFARACAEGSRAVFPDAQSGLYTHDELTDDGEIIDVEFEDPTPSQFQGIRTPNAGDHSETPAPSPVAPQPNPSAPTPMPALPTAPPAPTVPPAASPSAAGDAPGSGPITKPQIDTIQRLHAVIQTPRDEWQRHLTESYGVPTIMKISEFCAHALIRSMLSRVPRLDASAILLASGWTQAELRELGYWPFIEPPADIPAPVVPADPKDLPENLPEFQSWPPAQPDSPASAAPATPATSPTP